MWSMILLMSRLPGGHSMSAGRRSEKLGYQRYTVFSRMVTFPDGYFPGWFFSRKDVSRKVVSRIGRFPDGHFPGKTFPGWSFSRMTG